MLVAIGGAAFIHRSAQPSFCTSCHLMQPYYDSWASSSHNEVSCIECHYAPGIKAEAMGKLQAANQVVKYFTGTYGMKPWAEIEDAACLRSGCHIEDELVGELDFLGVLFNHNEHLGELRRGKQLRCTSCHSQIVQGDHLAVTKGTCFLCHFKERPEGEPLAGCTGCHRDPPRLVSDVGLVVDHPQYIQDLVSCESCHEQVISGLGEAEEPRCFNCHNELERIEQWTNSTRMHEIHISERNVECQQCHKPIDHRIQTLHVESELDCGSCHEGAHEVQQRMYAGVGGHGVEERPDPMFAAQVACKGCHELSRSIDAHATVTEAGEASCMSCHGVRYANILPAWQEGMARRVTTVGRLLRDVRSASGAAPVRSRVQVDSLVRLAADNIEFVERGKGAHNVQYADDLLRASVTILQEAIRIGRLPVTNANPDLGPRVTDSSCVACHLGVERSTTVYGGEEFSHGAHVLAGAMACSECHTSFDDHGGTKLAGISSCVDCHHSPIGPKNCAQCHQGPSGVPVETISHPTGDFSHNAHRTGDIQCSDCHIPPSMSTEALDCMSCHEQHHTPEVACLACHRDGALADHDAANHNVACIECHDPPADGINRWTRQVCASCHQTSLIDHYEPEACENCHQVPTMGEATRSLPPIPRDPDPPPP
ncbi:MAG: hypothetical protein E4H28_06625 [Gemmatimonadales bacterium]|nr:MAG: hypothetical protein E4H28_06625 [Gemmatimonadales bacterium]